MNRYEWKQVKPMMVGHWQAAFKSIAGLTDAQVNGRHQPCPVCGGTDRYRFTDKASERGDGGAICQQCGGGDGIVWLQRLTGDPFSDCVNVLGDFINAIPVEVRRKVSEQVVSRPTFAYSATIDADCCNNCIVPATSEEILRVTRVAGIYPESLAVALVPAENGVEGALRRKLAAPMRMVKGEHLAEEYCNVALVQFDTVSYLAGRLTFGAVSCIAPVQEGVIYLCSDWVTSWHVHHATGCEVWCSFRPSNSEHVARLYTGKRPLVFACERGDFDDLVYAEEVECQVAVVTSRDGRFVSVSAEAVDASVILDGGRL